MSSSGIIRVCSIAKVRHRMFINIMVVNEFIYLSVKCTPEYTIFHRFYKVLGSGISNVAKRCFTNGFLDLLEWP